MFYCDECRVKNDYPEGGFGFRSAGPCELCGETKECHEVSSKKIGEYLKEGKRYRFETNSWWFAPGMCENYRRARKVNDKDFIKWFENAYPDTPKEVFDLIAQGEFEIVGDEVIVNFLAQQGT